VMLEEIARKKAEAEQVRAEAQRRIDEGGCSDQKAAAATTRTQE
jgi:hypothetical protein